MCLMLYIGSAEELPVVASADLRVENVTGLAEALNSGSRFRQ